METVVVVKTVTFYEIFAIKMCMALTLTFTMRQGQMCKYGNRKHSMTFYSMTIVCICLTPFTRYLQVK